MAHFVQHLPNEKVVQNIYTELSHSYEANLKKQAKEETNVYITFPELNEWLIQQEKCLADKKFNGSFLLCYNARDKIFDLEHADGNIVYLT